MSAEDKLRTYPGSPCVGVCRMTQDGYCEGCRRTLPEIARWGGMSAAERLAVFRELEKRAESIFS